MNKNKLRPVCQDKARQLSLPFNSVYTCYFLEHVLRKVAIGRYNGNFLFDREWPSFPTLSLRGRRGACPRPDRGRQSIALFFN